MSHSLLELAKRALVLKNSGQPGQAAALYEQVLSSQPDWEHGYGVLAVFSKHGCSLGWIRK